MSRYTRVALLIGSFASVVWGGAHALGLFLIADKHLAPVLGFSTVPNQPGMQWLGGIMVIALGFGLACTTIQIGRREFKWIVAFLALFETFTLSIIFSLYGLYFPPVAALLSGASSFAMAFAFSRTEAGEKLTQLRRAVGRRISPKALSRVLSAPRLPSLEGELREVSVLVCEWFGQDAVGGYLKPEEWVEIHNRIAKVVSEVVLPAGGYLDQTNGEAIRVIFGAPLEDEQHGATACGAAVDILRSLDALNAALASEGRPPADCRIGINSGVAVVGVLAGETGQAYTVSGDTVARAHRFCSANLTYGSRILIGGRTVQLAEHDIESRPIELVGGRTDEELDEVHELLNRRHQLTAEEADRREAFWTGVILYRSQRIDEALECFVRARPNHGSVDPPVEFYVSRLENLRSPVRRMRTDTVKRLTSI